MQVTSLLSRLEATPPEPEVAAERAVSGRLKLTLIGLVFLLNAFALEWFFPRGAGLSGLSAFVGALILAAPILRTSFDDLHQGRLSINELVSLAVLASFATGDYKTAGIVALFMLVGDIIETRTAAGARASVESLIRLTPARASRVRTDGTEEEVPSADLRMDDVFRVRPGDNIPADGVIGRGASSLNQASITGESLPVDKQPGEEVFAGTVNLTGVLDVRVTRVGQDTTLGKVRSLILAAEASRLPLARIMDQYMGYYTPLVLTLAAMVWVFTRDLNRVIAVLVVACPCAFILAVPTTMVAALSAAARLGILIKNVADLELAGRLTAFIFDKTGTLTSGKLAVTRLAPLQGIQPAELLRLAASLEQHSKHPVARAIQQLAADVGVIPAEPADFAENPGRGVRGFLEGQPVLAGRADWLAANGVPRDFLEGVDVKEAEGFSLVFVARNGQCVGWLGLRDETRPEAAPALTELRDLGLRRVAMVTGDRQPVADRVAREIGCEEVAADCRPQDKVAFVRAVKQAGHRVAVVGDGVNDAPALASGDIGIAMGAAGSEAAIHSATIALMNNDLRRLPLLVTLSRAARRTISQNFTIGVLFIIGGLTLAAFGYLGPIVAALLHNAGSILVVFNSARLVRHSEEQAPAETAAPAPALGSWSRRT